MCNILRLIGDMVGRCSVEEGHARTMALSYSSIQK